MRIVLVNPHSPVFSPRLGIGNQIPLGLLAIGGPLADAGHDLSLVDVDAEGLDRNQAVDHILALRPEVVMMGHSGSTTAHPESMALARLVKKRLPQIPIVYGGVHPTYHFQTILASEPAVEIIVRGEGERTAVRVAQALQSGQPLSAIPGVAFRNGVQIIETGAAPLIEALDDCRVGWELIRNWDHYQCWGVGRAAAIQLSRGCPHQCSYCGQNRFWKKWRRRDPVKVVDQMEMLHRRHGVRFINIADENPAVSQRVWRRFLEELVSRKLPLALFGCMRAGDVVRDAELLPLYRQAGFVCINLGIETTEEETIRLIQKGSSVADDARALRLLRQNGILSMAGCVFGFQERRRLGFVAALRRLSAYDPDFLNALHATPHGWTPFARENAKRRVVQTDLARWDYRHPVLAEEAVSPGVAMLFVKGLEMAFHLRPTALWRLLFHRDSRCRWGLRWCYGRMARVWTAEMADFLIRLRFEPKPPPLDDFLPGGARPQALPSLPPPKIPCSPPVEILKRALP